MEKTSHCFQLIYLFILVSLIVATRSYPQNYPGCMKDLSQSQNDLNANINFINLTSFLFPSESYPQLLLQQKQKIKQGDFSFSTFSFSSIKQSQSLRQFQIGYYVIFGSVTLICFLLFILRTKGSYRKQLRLIMGFSIQATINPCMVITGIIWIIVLCVVTSYIYNYPAYITSINCSERYLKQLLLYGDNSSNWAGLYGFQNIINSQIKQTQIIQNMSTSYDFETVSIQNRMDVCAGYYHQFYDLYQSRQVTFNDNYNADPFKVKYSELLPSLLSSQITNRTLLNKFNVTLQRLYNASSTAIKIENLIHTIKSNLVVIKNSLKNRLALYSKPAKLIQKSKIFTFSEHSEYSNQKYNDINQLIILASRVYLAVGVQSGVAYVLLIVISLKVKNSLINKIIDFVWVLLLIQLILGVVLLYLYLTVIGQLSFKCTIFEEIRTNQQIYYSYASNSSDNQHMLKIFAPCLFPKQKKNTQTPYSNFTNSAYIDYRDQSIIYLTSNISLYANMINPQHSAYSNFFSYSYVKQEITSYVNAQMYNQHNNWTYLFDLVGQLEQYTLNGTFNNKCYKHKWVLNLQACPVGSQVLSIMNNNLLLSPSNYTNAPTTCLIITNRSYSQVLTNYNQLQPTCDPILTQIKNITQILTRAIKAKKDNLQQVIDTFEQYKQKLDEFARIIRTNQLLKISQYNYLVRLGGSTVYNAQSIKNFEYMGKQNSNCSVVKEKADQLYNLMCVDVRADVLKTYIFLIVQQIILAAFIVIGCIYGLNKQVRYIQYALEQIENNKASQSSFEDSKRYLNEKITKRVQHKYIQQLFMEGTGKMD